MERCKSGLIDYIAPDFLGRTRSVEIAVQGKVILIISKAEASDSGLFHHLGKVATGQLVREFESLRLRYVNSLIVLFRRKVAT